MRKALSKKIRFEVFKRDSFTCQYCGKTSPSVVLHVDHISPVSGGGDNDILNLITSCEGCNLGKSNIPLSDSSEIERQTEQLKELNKKREQLELMLKWRDELKGFDESVINEITGYFSAGIGNTFSISENGVKDAKKLLRKYPLHEILDAIDKSIENP